MDIKTLNHISLFIKVAEINSISEVARLSGRAQSYVSNSIMELEDNLGFLLFDRSNRYPVLTPLGKKVYEEAITLKEQLEKFSTRMTLLNSPENDEFTFASDKMVEFYEGRSLLHELNTIFPECRLKVVHPSNDEVLGMLVRKEVDAGLITGNLLIENTEVSLASCPISSTDIMCVCSPLSKLAYDKPKGLKELKESKQILISGRESILGTNRNAKRKFQVSTQFWEVDSPQQAADMAAAGLGWCILPLYLAKIYIDMNLLKEIPLIQGTLPTKLNGLLVWRKEDEDSSILSWLLSSFNAH